MIHYNIKNKCKHYFPLPTVIKLVRGRDRQGVSVVRTHAQLTKILKEMFASHQYGNPLYVEEFLPGEEITISVMPLGIYTIHHQSVIKEEYWSLPPVRRFNHQKGIAPYNGTVAIIHNNEVVKDEKLRSPLFKKLCKDCETTAFLVGAKAPIRIDCRENANGGISFI
ncbi:ATP-grasp domain-containing protein [Elizabethkingia argenteiflava]|uniref:hypothetical protein n=1 Tax=Elizabethkingia argenteiflava TaxID=2681556 RepID=UPI001FCE32A0|nr:hypothetical protein [Elizabethkingia argenteiflava]